MTSSIANLIDFGGLFFDLVVHGCSECLEACDGDEGNDADEDDVLDEVGAMFILAEDFDCALHDGKSGATFVPRRESR